MNDLLFFPESEAKAEGILFNAELCALSSMKLNDFMRIWCSVVYLNPGLHTDNFHDPDYECEPFVRYVLEEVWRRADSGEIQDDELYPSEVIHARLSALRNSMPVLTTA